jgi:hypothetical protein
MGRFFIPGQDTNSLRSAASGASRGFGVATKGNGSTHTPFFGGDKDKTRYPASGAKAIT